MRKILITIAVIILFFVVVFHHNTDPKSIIAGLTKKGPVRAGELKFRIYAFGVLPIGNAVFGAGKLEEYQGKQVCHLSATAQSLKVFSKIFSGSATLDSYVDVRELSPLSFRQRLAIFGKPDIQKEVIYDQKNGIMLLRGERRQILPRTQDPLSVMFNLRFMDFNKIKEFDMNINTNQKNYILKGTVQNKDLLVNSRLYKTVSLKSEIRRRDKDNPYHRSRISMTLLHEKENIPIMLKVFASGAFITAKLTDINEQ